MQENDKLTLSLDRDKLVNPAQKLGSTLTTRKLFFLKEGDLHAPRNIQGIQACDSEIP
jgi:hypothetical protein